MVWAKSKLFLTHEKEGILGQTFKVKKKKKRKSVTVWRAATPSTRFSPPPARTWFFGSEYHLTVVAGRHHLLQFLATRHLPHL
ncbi:hypothetical protein HanXRQr2_Chr09g0383481 [Helianthus annuus]|uniref:Uncharacterized protein n=1 Tax=Helianthus annuus TaxID=4232 RepID=A0A9K3I5E7_HELAN|nr:hypothetical protein HanXRQr2_Chr09g0383481 [Helianthus annuus]KAJ0892738.1 hypothetical protein HanPSC8_Chr09g0369561 [Helianthus annuus]